VSSQFVAQPLGYTPGIGGLTLAPLLTPVMVQSAAAAWARTPWDGIERRGGGE